MEPSYSLFIKQIQYGSATSESCTPSATHDISRVKYHVKHLESFVSTLQEVRFMSM